jgi:hypothetical protein
MPTRNPSEVERRRLRVRSKRTQTRPPTQASNPAVGSSPRRNSARGRKARFAKHSGPSTRLPIRRRPSSAVVAMPPEFEHAIDDQRRELATAMTLLHCLHCVLRRETDDISSHESEAVEDATEWVELPDVTAMLLVRLHAVHLALDSVSLKHAARGTAV